MSCSTSIAWILWSEVEGIERVPVLALRCIIRLCLRASVGERGWNFLFISVLWVPVGRAAPLRFRPFKTHANSYSAHPRSHVLLAFPDCRVWEALMLQDNFEGCRVKFGQLDRIKSPLFTGIYWLERGLTLELSERTLTECISVVGCLISFKQYYPAIRTFLQLGMILIVLSLCEREQVESNLKYCFGLHWARDASVVFCEK